MKKDEFRKKAHGILDEVVDRIKEMEDKAGDVKEDAKKEYDEQLKKLKDIQKDLSSKLEEYEGIAETKWDILKGGTKDFFEKVLEAWRENYDKVSTAFKKVDEKKK